MSPGYWAKCEGFWHPRRSLGPWNRCPSTLRWHFLAGQWNWSRDRSRMSRTGQHWRCTKIQVPARKRGHICNRQSCSTGSHFLARQIVKLEWARFVLPPQQHQLPPRRRRTRYEETWPWMSGWLSRQSCKAQMLQVNQFPRQEGSLSFQGPCQVRQSFPTKMETCFSVVSGTVPLCSHSLNQC